MKITEQLYKNLNRPYYHGTTYDTLDYSKSRYNAIYLTNSFAYATIHAAREGNEHGKVFEYRLTEGMNIFNSYSKSDVNKLKLEIFRALKNKESLFYNIYHDYTFDNSFFEKLCNQDWSNFLRGDKNRDCFVKVIIQAGFDGYFNFEWQNEYREENEIEFGFEVDNAPSLGIFNISKMKVVREINYKEFFEFPDFVEAYNKDVDRLSQYVSNLYNNEIEDYESLTYKYASENLLFLDFDTVTDIVSDPEDLDEKYQHTKLAKLFKECIDYGRSKDSYNGFVCYLTNRYLFDWKKK